MSIVIREADLIRDQDILIKTLNESRTKSTDERRYRWRYLENPHGRPKAWLAIDELKGIVAGFTVVHPRLMSVDGKDVVCWNCGDFSINKRYRTLGVAVKLRSAATACVNQGEVPFLYAHPNDRMTVIHLRVGHQVLGQMVRYARPLGLNQYLPDRLKDSSVSFAVGWAYHRGVSVLKGTSRFSRPFRCELHDRFTDDPPYEDLLERARKGFKVFGVRDKVYLKWRFAMKPSLKIFSLLLYRGDEFVGYAFCSWQERVICVHDLFSLPEEEVFNGLIAHLTDMAYVLKAQAVSVVLFESNPIIQSLRRNGYFLRPDRSNVIVYPSSQVAWGRIVQEKKNWFMTVGDRDV